MISKHPQTIKFFHEIIRRPDSRILIGVISVNNVFHPCVKALSFVHGCMLRIISKCTDKCLVYTPVFFVLTAILLCSKATANDQSSKSSFYLKVDNIHDSARLAVYVSNVANELNQVFQQGGNAHVTLSDINKVIYKSDSLRLFEMKYSAVKLKGDLYLLKNDIINGKHFYDQAIGYYRKLSRKADEANAWFMLGANMQSVPSNNSYDLMISCFQNAKTLYEQLNQPLKAIDCRKAIANAYMGQGKLSLAEQGLLEVLKQYTAQHFKSLEGTYDLLAYTARLQGDLKKELYYRLAVVKSMEANRDFTYALTYYGALGKTYTDLKNYERAGFYLEKALATPNAEKDYTYTAYCSFLIHNLIFQRKGELAIEHMNKFYLKFRPIDVYNRLIVLQLFSDCYQELKNYRAAEGYQLKVLNLSDSAYRTKAITTQVFFKHVKLSVEFYIKTGRYDRAKYYLNWLKMVPQVGVVSPISISVLELDAFKIDSAFNNYKSAMIHFRNYVALRDSLFNISKTRETDAMQYRFETEKKDKDLQIQRKNILLLREQAQVERTQREHNSVKFDLTIITAVVLLLLLSLTYIGYTVKRRSNLMLEKKQNEIAEKNVSLQHLLTENEWLLKEIHHRVKNNLQMITALLNSQSLYLKDPVALNAIMESQRRVQSMALIHQKLYKDSNYSSIFMPDYVLELITYLKQSFDGNSSIRFCLNIDPISLDITNALPVGLIVNEAVTNAIKYAFPFLVITG